MPPIALDAPEPRQAAGAAVGVRGSRLHALTALHGCCCLLDGPVACEGLPRPAQAAGGPQCVALVLLVGGQPPWTMEAAIGRPY